MNSCCVASEEIFRYFFVYVDLLVFGVTVGYMV